MFLLHMWVDNQYFQSDIMIRPRLRTQNGMGMGQNLSPMGPQILVCVYIYIVFILILFF